MNLSRLVAFCLTVVSSESADALGIDGFDLPTLCLQAAKDAAEETGVPLRVLIALTLTETGKSHKGKLQPWPWALNDGGESHWFNTPDEALSYLEQSLASGSTNVDVGCFQLNYRWHGEAFSSLEEMIDPAANARYAAKLLAKLGRQNQDWISAAGAYHSATPDVADRYLARFEPILASLGELPEADPTASFAESRPNAFPLLVRGTTGKAGSIVPLSSSARPLFGGP